MKEDSEETKNPLDILRWGVVLMLISGGIAANSYYAAQPLSLRLIAWIFLVAIVLGVVAFTTKGKDILAYAREARVELRKVVWPTRQETVQTTLIVIVMVTIMGFILWGMDSVLLWLIGFLTGQRG